MPDLKAILDQPIGTVLILLGAAFFAAAAVRQLKEWFRLDGLGRLAAFVSGVILIGLGVLTHLGLVPIDPSRIQPGEQGRPTGMPPEASRAFDIASGWNTIVTDDFSENTSGWYEGKWATESSSGRMYLERRYRIEVRSKSEDSWVWSVATNVASMDNFYMTVDAQKLKGGGSAYGVLFRESRPNAKSAIRYYSFSIDNAGGRYGVVASDGRLTGILPLKNMSVVRKYEINRLGVLALDGRFYYFVNGSYVGTASDDALKEGCIGVFANYSPKEEVVVEFDNLVLRRP